MIYKELARTEEHPDADTICSQIRKRMPPDACRRTEAAGGKHREGLKKAPKQIQDKMVAHFRKADQAYGDGITKGLGLS